MIVGDIDLGGRPTILTPQSGIVMGSSIVLGSRTRVHPTAGAVSALDISFWITAWQPVGGAPALSLQANRYLRQQLKELSLNPDLHPVYIQWAQTAQPNPVMPARADADDGWYVIGNLTWDPETYNQAGAIEARMTVSQVAPSAPSSLSVLFSGGALSSTYAGAATPLVAFPLSSTGQPPTTLSRTGAEGVLQLSANPVPNPVPFTRPSTVAGLYQGGCRVYDTIVAGGNAVPAAGTFVNASWVQVYSAQHDFAGDVVVTNGLLLLLFQIGLGQVCNIYLWNTSLSPAAWQALGQIASLDNASLGGFLRTLDLEQVGLEEVRLRARENTSGGNWNEVRLKLQRGSYAVRVEYEPLTQAAIAQLGLMWNNLTNAAKIDYSELGAIDVVTTTLTNVSAASANLGFAAVISAAANSPILGILYQNAPASQGFGYSSAALGFGDTTSLAVGSSRTYGFFAAPFATAPNLLAEAESGALGTGWSSVADAAASGGNAAKAASGTAVANADLFGASWVPPAGQYDVWYRVRVTSAAGSTGEMTLGLWDATSSAFVAGSSTAFRANQAATSYVWLKANGTSPLTPTGAHNMQFRAVTAGTLGTDWFIDEAALVPIRSVALGTDSFPGDIWSQFMFDKSAYLVRG